MTTVRLVFGFFCLLLLAYLAYNIVTQYYKEKNLTGWARWRATARDSATFLFAKLVAIVGSMLGGAGQLADVLNMPELRDWFNSHISDAKTLSTIMLAIALGTVLTRFRTLGASNDNS